MLHLACIKFELHFALVNLHPITIKFPLTSCCYPFFPPKFYTQTYFYVEFFYFLWTWAGFSLVHWTSHSTTRVFFLHQAVISHHFQTLLFSKRGCMNIKIIIIINQLMGCMSKFWNFTHKSYLRQYSWCYSKPKWDFTKLCELSILLPRKFSVINVIKVSLVYLTSTFFRKETNIFIHDMKIKSIKPCM